MNKQSIANAFGVAPDSFRVQVNDVLDRLEDKPMKQSYKMIILVAALLTMALVGTAVAAAFHSDILDRLFGNRAPSPEAESALVRDGTRAEDAGILLSLDEYLADTNTLNLSWTVRSDREEPVYYVTWYEIDDGGLDELNESDYLYPNNWSDASIGDGAIVRLSPEADAYTSGSSAGWSHAIDRPVTVRIHALAYTTALEAVPSELGQAALCHAEPGTAEEEALLRAEDAGRLLVASDLPLCYVSSYRTYRSALEAGMEAVSGDTDELTDEDLYRAEADALAKSGLFQPLTELVVEATVNPPADALYSLPRPMTFDLPGRRVELKALRVDAASTMIRYDVWPEGERTEGADMSWYLVADPSGRVLNVDWLLGVSGESETVRLDGESREVLHYTLVGDSPVSELPDSLTFVPVRDVPREEGERPADYWQRVSDLAAPEECFTVPLKG